jgi:hypothetical protein
MRLTLAAVAAAAAVLCSCTATLTPYSVRPFSDEFEGTRGVAMHNNLVGGLGLHGERLGLNLRRVERPGAAPAYVMVVEYVNTGWHFIEDGESLVFLVDGERMALRGEGSVGSRTVVTGDQVRELAVYAIDRTQVERIAGAGEVRVRLAGANGNIDRTLAPENIARFREFVLTETQGTPLSP